ncbi:MAG: hypothetical protein J6L69_00075 [Lachnospiraceae bacterium]|nr:hypothetical protein [Lachnospiraceae bacterium]
MSKKKKIIAISAVSAIALIIAGFFVKGWLYKPPSVISLYDEDADTSSIYFNSKLIGEMNGKALLENNMDNTSYYAISDEECYYIENKKMTKVGEDLEFVMISNHSSEALFINADDELCIYRDDELQVITDENVEYAAISGNGEYYSYSNDEAAYLGKDIGDEVKIEDIVIPCISEDADIVYGLKYKDNKFDIYTVDLNGDTKLIYEEASGINGLNEDGTEIMFYGIDGTFVCIDGKDIKQVSENIVNSIYHYNKKQFDNNDFFAIKSFAGAVCDVRDISGKKSVKNISLISKDYKEEVLVDNCYLFVGISSKMDKVFYVDDNKDLFRLNTKKGATSDLLANDVELVRISPDGNDVYFTRQIDSEITGLYHVEKGLKEKEVALVYDFFDVIVFDNHAYVEANKIYCIEDGEIEELEYTDSLEGFFVDYMAQKTYAYDKTSLYEIKGKDRKELEGKFESIKEYDFAY